MLLPLLLAPATAGTVEVQATVPVEVFLNGTSALRTSGPTSAQLLQIPAGEHRLVIYRGGTPHTLDITLESEGRVCVRVGSDLIESDAPAPATAPPLVLLRATTGERFRIVLDGRSLGILDADHPLSLSALAIGEHTLEIRSPDGLVVWVRGSLRLQAGDDLQIHIREGRMFEVFGRGDAWKPGG